MRSTLQRLWIATLLLPGMASAQTSALVADTPEAFNAKFQATYIWQKKPAFNAPYSGVNSLLPSAEKSYSFTSTAYLGLRLAEGTELYFNPEVVQGVPMSGLTGLGGLSNAELQKTAGASRCCTAPGCLCGRPGTSAMTVKPLRQMQTSWLACAATTAWC